MKSKKVKKKILKGKDQRRGRQFKRNEEKDKGK